MGNAKKAKPILPTVTIYLSYLVIVSVTDIKFFVRLGILLDKIFIRILVSTEISRECAAFCVPPFSRPAVNAEECTDKTVK